MIDIVQEILSEAPTTPPSLARECAEAAMKLYQEAAQVCSRFDLPMECIYTEVWTRGTPVSHSKPVPTSQLWFDAGLGHFVLHSERPTPHGPDVPFGASWLLLDSKPSRVRAKKEREKDLYKVLVAYWEHPSSKRNVRSGLPPYQIKWRYAKVKPHMLWYMGEKGERCDGCKEEVWGEHVAIEQGHLLRCQGCYLKAHPEKGKAWHPTAPSVTLLEQVVDVAAGVDAEIPVPSYSQHVRVQALLSGDVMTQLSVVGWPLLQHVLPLNRVSLALVPEATTLIYSSLTGGRLSLQFETSRPESTRPTTQAASTLTLGGQRPNLPQNERRAAPRSRRGGYLPPPSTQTAGGLDALLRDINNLSPLGKVVAFGVGALALQALMPPGTTTPEALDAFSQPPAAPTKEAQDAKSIFNTRPKP